MKRIVVSLFIVLSACGGSTSIGSRYVKSQQVSAAEGGLISVTAAESAELSLAEISIPPGALAADTVLTVELGLDELTPGRASAVLVLGPAGTTLSRELEIALPLVLDDRQRSAEVTVLKADDSGQERLAGPSLTRDDSTGRVRFRTSRLGAFQASAAAVVDGGLVACVTDDVCTDAQDCVLGACTPKHWGSNGDACVTDDTCPDDSDCVGGRCVAKSRDDSP